MSRWQLVSRLRRGECSLTRPFPLLPPTRFFVYSPVKHSIICHIVSREQNGWSCRRCRRPLIGLPRLSGAMATANGRPASPARRQGRLRHPRPAEGPPRSLPICAICARGTSSRPRPWLSAGAARGVLGRPGQQAAAGASARGERRGPVGGKRPYGHVRVTARRSFGARNSSAKITRRGAVWALRASGRLRVGKRDSHSSNSQPASQRRSPNPHSLTET